MEVVKKVRIGAARSPGLEEDPLRAHLLERLGTTKRLLVSHYLETDLTFHEADAIAGRLLRKYGRAWREA